MEYGDGAIVPAQVIPLCIWIQTVVGDFMTNDNSQRKGAKLHRK